MREEIHRTGSKTSPSGDVAGAKKFENGSGRPTTWTQPVILSLLEAIAVSVPQAASQTVEGQRTADCPHFEGWKPSDSQGVLTEHREWSAKWRAEKFSLTWAESHPQGRANLCFADLRGAKLERASVSWAQLKEANLYGAKLNEANLYAAELN